MIVTLDVSAAVELVMGRPKQKLIISILKEAEWIIAPSLFAYEATNVMWKYSKLSDYPVDELIHKTRHMLEIIDEYIDPEVIYEEAIALACRIDHPAYAAMYLVTSRRRNATLITLDFRLMAAASKLQIPVASFD